MAGHTEESMLPICGSVSLGMSCWLKGAVNVLWIHVFTYGRTLSDGQYQPLGCLGIHVDDGIGGGTPEFRDMLSRVEKKFKFGAFETGQFKYTGINFRQWDDGSVEYDQKEYIEKIQPIVVPKERRGQPESPVSEAERRPHSARSLCKDWGNPNGGHQSNGG